MSNDVAVPGPDEFGMVAVPPGDFPDLSKADVGISVDPKYYEFKDGESVRAVFCGFMMIKNNTVKAAVLQRETDFILNGGVSLVSQMELLPRGTPVQIIYMGKRAVKDGAEGARANIFQVNILKNIPGAKVYLPVSVPPPPAIPATVPAGSQPKQRVARPLDPDKLKSYFPAKIQRNAQTMATQFHRGVLAVKLESLFDGDKQTQKEMRNVLTGWLIGKEHISDMNQAEVNALLDWLEARTFEAEVPAYVKQEAESVYARGVFDASSKTIEGQITE